MGDIPLSYYETDKTITICRKTFPSLRASVMRDFFEILRSQRPV
jgi:hypothetical protein